MLHGFCNYVKYKKMNYLIKILRTSLILCLVPVISEEE